MAIPFRDTAAAVRGGRGLRHAGIWPAVQLGPRDWPGRAVLLFFITALPAAEKIDSPVEALGASAPV